MSIKKKSIEDDLNQVAKFISTMKMKDLDLEVTEQKKDEFPVINVKRYQFWSGIINRKECFIGGVLEETHHGEIYKTKIIDIAIRQMAPILRTLKLLVKNSRVVLMFTTVG